MAQDRGPELTAVLGVFLGLSWIFVSLRVYVKTRISKNWAPDDTLLMISLTFYTTYCICAALGVKYGTGRHLTDIPKKDIPKALFYWWLCELFYTMTTVLIRISIAVFLLRLIVKPVHRHLVYGTMSVVCIFSTSYFFLVSFQCSPYSYFWGQFKGEKGKCVNDAVVPNASIAHSIISFAADWVLGLLPCALLYDLNLNWRTKISVAGLLSLGLLAGLATLIRIPFIRVLALTDDFLFATIDVAIWSSVEPGLGIVAFAAATLRPLFRSFYDLTTRTSRSTHSRASRAIKLGERNERPWDGGVRKSMRNEGVVVNVVGGERGDDLQVGNGMRKEGEEIVISQSEEHVDNDSRMDDGKDDSSTKSVLTSSNNSDKKSTTGSGDSGIGGQHGVWSGHHGDIV